MNHNLRNLASNYGSKWHRVTLFLAVFFVISLAQPPAKTVGANSTTSTDPWVITSTLGKVNQYITVTNNTPVPSIDATAYILYEPETATVIAGNRIHKQLPIASTTKMANALVAKEVLDQNQVTTITRAAVSVGGSTANLYIGEKLTVKDLLSAMLIPSGNDAAYSIAFAYSGNDSNYQSYVNKMNEYAVNHNLIDTHYADPSGLDDSGYSSAFDLANTAVLLLNDPDLSKIVNTQSETIYSTDKRYSNELINSNHLIINNDPYFLPGVVGVKTGNTDAAGHCLVAAYQLNGRILIGVVLNTYLDSPYATAREMQKLFLWANNNVTFNTY